MTYSILGQNLHETADRAKKYFASNYGASKFECEQVLDVDLPLKPTWQATMGGGYRLCIDVRETPFSNSLYAFVSQRAARGMPIRLWVAVPQGAAVPTFNVELKQARDVGVGVVQIAEDGSGHEFHRPVALSLFALKKTNLKAVPKLGREEIKTAESTFLDGTPDQACQALCQAIELLTRQFAEYTFGQGWWRQPAGARKINSKFFQTHPWAAMLEEMEVRVDVQKVRLKCAPFSKQSIVKVRGQTDWRNSLSHKPKTFKQLQARDAKLRTMFEATRDLLLEWLLIAKILKLKK